MEKKDKTKRDKVHKMSKAELYSKENLYIDMLARDL